MRLSLLLLAACGHPTLGRDLTPGDVELHPDLRACLDATPPDAATVLAGLGGEASVLAAFAPGDLVASSDLGGDVPLRIDAAVSGTAVVTRELLSYPDGDARIVADGMACADRLRLPVTTTLADPQARWTVSFPGDAYVTPTEQLPPSGTQITVYSAEARVDSVTATAMRLPDDATRRLQTGAYAWIGHPESLVGWLVIERDGTEPGGDTGRGTSETRWRW